MPLSLPLSQALLTEHVHAPRDQAALGAYVAEAAADHHAQGFKFLLLGAKLTGWATFLQLIQL